MSYTVTGWRTIGGGLVACLVIAAIAGVALGATAAAAQQSDEIPAAYYGEITVDGEPAPEGTTIEAVIDGELRGEITVEEAGRYGGDPDRPDAKRLTVNGTADDAGAEVEFRVHGPDFDRTVAEETVSWSAGDARELDLTVELPDEGTDGGGGGGSSPVPAPSQPDDGEAEPPLVLAAIDVQPASPTVGDEVTLSAGGSVAEGGSIAAYEWTVDGEAAGTDETVTTTFDQAGEYEVELAIEDDDGTTDTTTTTVTVEDPDADDDADETGDEDDGGDEMPGFGAVTTLVALVALVVAGRVSVRG